MELPWPLPTISAASRFVSPMKSAFARGLQQTVRLTNELIEQGMARWVADKKEKGK